MGKGLEKVNLTIAFFKTPGWLIVITGDPTLRSNKNEEDKSDTFNYRRMECAQSNGQVLTIPQSRTALVVRELDRYKVDIAAVSETRLAEEGLLKEVGTGYTFFWSERKKEERREAGVGFAIKSHLVSKLSGLPKGINDRLMSLRLPVSGTRHAKIVSAQ